MATVVFGAVGAITGSLFGNWMTGWAVGTLVGGLLFPRGGGGTIDRGKLDDVRVTASTYGVTIPQVYGTMRVGGNIIWAAELREVVSSEEQGGKGGGGGTTVNTYSYFSDVAIAICRGPITKVVQILADREVIYDEARTPTTDLDIEIHLGTSPQTVSSFLESALGGPGSTPAYNGIAYVVIKNWDVSQYGNRIPNLEFIVETPNNTVQSVLEDVASQCNISSSLYDFSAATDTFIGFIIPHRTEAKDAVRDLLTYGACDIIEVDGEIRAVRRGASSIRTLSVQDMGAIMWNGQDGMDEVVIVDATRREEHELPTRLDLTYYSPANTYQVANASAARFTKAHINNQSMTMPMSLSDTIARQLAERLIYEQYAERNIMKTTLSLKHIELTPADVLTVPVYGKNTRCRVISTDVVSFGRIAIELVRDDANVLTQVVEGGTPGTGITLPFNGIAEIVSYVWSGVALKDYIAKDGRIGLYVAVNGPSGWGGAKAYISRDNGASWQVLANVPEYAPVGIADTALSGLRLDNLQDVLHTVDIQLDRGIPASVGYADILAGSNAILIGEEVLQYQTASIVDADEGIYRLSNLLRGRRGTEYYQWSHDTNEIAVMLWPSIQWIPVEFGLLNKEVLIRVVPAGGAFADYMDTPVVVKGSELKPYPVVNFGATRATNDIILTWQRRARYENELVDFSEIPLTDSPESYSIDVLSLDTIVTYSGSPALGVIVDSTTPLSRSTAFTIPIPIADDYEQAWLKLDGVHEASDSRTLSIELDGIRQLIPLGGIGRHYQVHRLSYEVLAAINSAISMDMALDISISGTGSFRVTDVQLILTESGAATVRTLSASTPTVTYTGAQQTTDFGSAQSNVHFRVYQLNSVVGRGHPADLLVGASGVVWPNKANIT